MSTAYQAHLDEFERKRVLLASLIKVASDFSGHTQSMRNAWLLARPSQNYPARLKEYKKQVIDKVPLNKMADHDLLEASKKVDLECSQLLDALLNFVELAGAHDKDSEEAYTLPAELRDKLIAFSDASRLAVAIKIELQNHGVMTPPVKFSVPQEIIGEQVDELVEVNKELKKDIAAKMKELAADVVKILSLKALPGALRDKLGYVKHVLSLNLQHLGNKGGIEKFPYDVDALELSEISENDVSNYLLDTQKKDDSEQGTQDSTTAKTAQVGARNSEPKAPKGKENSKLGFGKKARKWLDSPWGTRWKDLD